MTSVSERHSFASGPPYAIASGYTVQWWKVKGGTGINPCRLNDARSVATPKTWRATVFTEAFMNGNLKPDVAFVFMFFGLATGVERNLYRTAITGCQIKAVLRQSPGKCGRVEITRTAGRQDGRQG